MNDTRNHLARAVRHLDALSLAAHSVENNVLWLEFSANSEFIPLLDFDIVCGSLPTIAASRAIDALSDPFDSTILQPSGPNAVHYTVDALGTYTVPHGAAIEMLQPHAYS